jgi:hypothetical protein
MTKHQCVQFGVCSRADSGECFEVNSDFKCGRNPEDPDCQSKLEGLEAGGSKGLAFKIGIPVILLVAIGGSILFLMGNRDNANPPSPEQKPTVEELLQQVWPWLK